MTLEVPHPIVDDRKVTLNFERLRTWSDLTEEDIAGLDTRIDTLETIEPWVAPTFTNSWVNFGGTRETAGYYKDRDRVYLKGSIKNGTLSTAAFTLPSGYRPAADLVFSRGTLGAVVIGSNGAVTIVYSANTDVPLDGIGFRVG